jgi:hypothetical protein
LETLRNIDVAESADEISKTLVMHRPNQTPQVNRSDKTVEEKQQDVLSSFIPEPITDDKSILDLSIKTDTSDRSKSSVTSNTHTPRCPSAQNK